LRHQVGEKCRDLDELLEKQESPKPQKQIGFKRNNGWWNCLVGCKLSTIYPSLQTGL